MEIKFVLAFYFLLVAVQAKLSMVELTQEWKPNLGWEVICSWTLPANDSLQSVRLVRSDQQFFIYRPEREGPNRSILMRLHTMEFQLHCFETQDGGVTGKCINRMEILQPMKEDVSYTCEVSGERPTFRTESKTINIEALVRPSDTVVERIGGKDETSERVSVNCSSSGLPAPNLVWTIGDQKIPEDFSGGAWNFTSKLYHMWSSVSYTPADSGSHAVCTPETMRAGQLLKGNPAHYNNAAVVRGATTLCSCLIVVLTLTR